MKDSRKKLKMHSWIAIDHWRRIGDEVFPVTGFRVLAINREVAGFVADHTGEYSELAPVVLEIGEIKNDKSLLN
jgi:hypothetical protein